MIAALVDRLRAAGVQFTLTDTGVEVEVAPGILTDPDRASLRAERDAIRQLLEAEAEEAARAFTSTVIQPDEDPNRLRDEAAWRRKHFGNFERWSIGWRAKDFERDAPVPPDFHTLVPARAWLGREKA
jgi:hypothetical protein